MTTIMPELKSSCGLVLAIVVAYRPEESALRKLLLALLAQVDEVLVIDNLQKPSEN